MDDNANTVSLDTRMHATPRFPYLAGSWSNYPYFESRIIVVTSGKEGVFVVRRGPRVLIP